MCVYIADTQYKHKVTENIHKILNTNMSKFVKGISLGIEWVE